MVKGSVSVETGDAGLLRELQQRVRRYELIFAATNDVVYELRLDTGTVAWSDALFTQYGYKRTKTVATLEWWTSHVHPDDAFLIENKVTDLFAGKTNSWQCDYRFRRADGGYNYVHDRGLLLRDADGKPAGMIGSLLDMTAQKQLDTAKDEFISLVSHQLRTPLTVIRVYGEMLTGGMFGNLSPEQARWVRNMTNSSARLIDVVGDILNISRIDLGRINITSRLQQLPPVIAACIRDVQPLADEKGVSVSFTAMPDSPLVAIDENVLSQITHNLLTNAIRYTPRGKGRVEVGLSGQRGGYLLSVADNGIGIPKEAQAHIFGRFYRAKNALGVDATGSGLGLYLVKVMTEAFGGKVWFKSGPGRGTTFYVLIPKVGMAVQRSK